MQRILRYLSHPQVLIEPDKEVENWSLNGTGRTRVASLVRSGALVDTRVVISSAETKALETARPIARALACEVDVRPNMHENDRSATGFLPPDEFETVADQFFKSPFTSVRGWETAIAAQAQIVAEVRDCLWSYPDTNLLFVGHGGVDASLLSPVRCGHQP